MFEDYLKSDKNANDFIKDMGIEQISDQEEIKDLLICFTKNAKW